MIDERGAVCEKNREIDWGSEQDKEVEERNRPKISQSWVWTARRSVAKMCSQAKRIGHMTDMAGHCWRPKKRGARSSIYGAEIQPWTCTVSS